MQYAEHAPAQRLARHVSCLWSFESEAAAAPDRIVPDGRPELIIHFGAPYAEVDAGGRARVQARALFAGQITRPLKLRASGRAGVLAVRFHADGARAFLGIPMRGTSDARIALDDLWPAEGTRLAQAAAGARDHASRAAIAEQFVAERIAASAHEDDAVVRRSVERIEAARGQVELVELIASAGVGRRQLERRFADAVGIGPALLSAIFRFRSAFDLLEHDTSRPWTEAALAAGYYDQSHFIREFRRFVGCTPSEFLRTSEGIATALALP